MARFLQRIKSRLFIFAHRRTLGLLDGEYGSVFHGRSLDFDELRSYVAGEDVRDIDWKATARHGAPLTKRYVAVRRQTVLLVADTGRNMAAASHSGEDKRELAVQALGTIGYLAQRHGDDVGLVHGSSSDSRFLRPSLREEDLERMLQEVHGSATPDAPQSGVAEQLRYILRTFRRRMLVFVVADEFLHDGEFEWLLRRLAARHEVLWFTVRDAVLANGPPATVDGGLRDDVDVAAGLLLPGLPAAADAVRSAYDRAMAEREARRALAYRRLGIAEGGAGGSDAVVTALYALLERHRRRNHTVSGHHSAG